MSSDANDVSKKRFVVFIYEVRQELVFGEEFSGRYTRSVTLSDGTTRTIDLIPTVKDGVPVVEFNDTGHRSYMGPVRAAAATTTNGTLMVHLADLDDLEAGLAERRDRRSPASTILPPDASLLSVPGFVPAGFTHGVEILNDDTTPMKFVADALTAHAGLSSEEAERTMLAIHTQGGALIPTQSLEDARRAAAGITNEASDHGYPLVCRAIGIGSRTIIEG
jgi:ATP-dependent Clp protease adapter protein ClpS